MEREYKITPYQLFSILFLIKVVTMLTYSSQFSGSISIWDYSISAVVTFILTFILVCPTYIIYKKFPNLNLFRGKLGFIYIVIYSIYYILIASYFMSIFKLFTINVMAPYMPLSIISIFTFILAVYSSKKGIHAVARTSVIILFITIVSLLFIYSTLSNKIEVEKFMPILKNGLSDVFNGILYFTSRNFGLSIFPVIIPFIKGNFKKTIISFNILLCILSIMIVVLSVGALGNFLETQEFPIYWATKVAEFGVIRRLDAIYVGIFVSGMFIVISMFLCLFRFVCSNFFWKSSRTISTNIGIILLFIFGVSLSQIKTFEYFIYNKFILLILNLLTAFILPLIYLLKELNKNKKRRLKNEKNNIFHN